MDREERRKVIAHCLVDSGETIASWSARQGLHHKIVTDLIAGKLKGRRGIAMLTRRKIEESFGKVFEQ